MSFIIGGQYIYFETSSPVKAGESALIRSANLTSTDDVCVTFWYNMYGQTMGKLEMGTMTDLDSSTLQIKWSREGDQGPTWKQAKVTVESPQSFYVCIHRPNILSIAKRQTFSHVFPDLI